VTPETATMRLLHPLQTYMAHNWKIFNRIKPDIRLISAESAKMCTGEEEGPKKQQNRELPVPNKNLSLDAKQMGGIMEVLLNEPNSLERREEELKKRVRRSGVKAKVGVVFRAFKERGEREAVLMEVGWKFNRFLPPGWMCREAEPKRVKILNPQGKVLISIQQVVDHMASSPSYTREDCNKFLLYPEGSCSEARRNKFQNMVQEKEQVVEQVGEARQVEEQMEEEATVEQEKEVQEIHEVICLGSDHETRQQY